MLHAAVVSLLLVGTSAEPIEVRAAIEVVLAEMSDAVESSNADAYLRHVWMDDSEFATEQRAWAADLLINPVAAFEIEIDDLELRDDGDAVTDIQVRWTLAESDDERSVSFDALFVAPHEPSGRWLYAGPAWETLESGSVIVRYWPGMLPAAERVVESLPAIRTHVHEGFEIESNHVQEVKLYGSMRHLQFSIYPSYVQGLGGWNEPDEAIKILARRRMGQRYTNVLLAHEYAHVACFLMGEESNDIPWWVMEGMAELAAERYAGDAAMVDRMVVAWAEDGRLAEWDAMTDFRETDPALQSHVYKQGQHLVGYVSQRWGRRDRNDWLKRMARGASLDQATRDQLGLSFADLDEIWRASILGPESWKAHATESQRD